MDLDIVRTRRIFLAVGLVVALFGGMLAAVSLRDVWKGGQSRTWTTVVGEMRESSVRRTPASGGKSYGSVVEARYRYEVAGRSLEGDQIRIHNDLQERDRLLVPERYPVGSKVVVHYDPADPTDAVLEPGPQSGAAVGVAVGVGILLFGGVFVFVAIRGTPVPPGIPDPPHGD